jgi:hypothetical protein
MKSRLIFAAILVAVALGFYYVTIKPTQTSSHGITRKRLERLRESLTPPEIAPPPLPVPVVSMPQIPPPSLLEQPIVLPPVLPRRDTRRPSPPLEVPIQTGTTIDFSIGAPTVRSGGKDQDALDRALREMAEATKETTFPPTKK